MKLEDLLKLLKNFDAGAEVLKFELRLDNGTHLKVGKKEDKFSKIVEELVEEINKQTAEEFDTFYQKPRKLWPVTPVTPWDPPTFPWPSWPSPFPGPSDPPYKGPTC